MASQLETVRNFGAAVLVAGTLYGCAPKTPEVQRSSPPVAPSENLQVRTEDTSNWLSQPIDADRTKLYSFDEVMNYQCAPIGLSKLYIMSDTSYPLVAIGVIADQLKASRTAANESRIPGGIGFQQIGRSLFSIDFSRAVTSVPGTIPSAARDEFIRHSYQVMNIGSEGLLDNRQASIYAVVERPREGTVNALVLQRGILQFQGRPSPQSCLKVMYGFSSTPSIPFPFPTQST